MSVIYICDESHVYKVICRRIDKESNRIASLFYNWFVITKTVSRSRTISVLWIALFVINISRCTSSSISCNISFFSIIRWRTKILYKGSLRRFWSSISFSFAFIMSLFFETSWDRLICFVTIRAILLICRFVLVFWISRLCKHKLFLLWCNKSLCL